MSGRGLRVPLTLLCVALLTASAAVACTVVPTEPSPAVPDVAYAEPDGGRGHLLDLYLPAGAVGPVPVVIWTGGSGWFSDDGRSGAAPVAAALVPRGFAVAGVSVRSSDQVRFPGQVHDLKAAVRWLRARGAAHGIDPSRIVAAGDSSGGWTALMAGLTDGVPELEGDRGITGVSSRVQAVLALYPPTAFDRATAQMLPDACSEFFGGLPGCHDDPASPESRLLGCALPRCPPERIAAADPRSHVTADDPPVVLVHGDADRVVPLGQSLLLRDALGAGGRLYTVPGAGHAVDEVLSGPSPTWDELAGLLRTAR